MTRLELPALTEPEPGFQLCPSCGGMRVCAVCRGKGHYLSGGTCKDCLGRKYCIGCDGAGQIDASIAV